MKRVTLKDDNGNELNIEETFKQLKEGKSIEVEFNFSEKGRIIEAQILEEKWQNLKTKLKEMGYPVASFQMPQIQALVVMPKDFDAIIKELFYIGSPEKEEYGKIEHPDTTTSAFIKDISGSKKRYLLFKCEGRYDLNKDLEHELTHIFEDFLNFNSGELINKLKNEK